MSKKRTVGSISTELLQKVPETRSPIEIQREMQKEYMKELLTAVDRGFKRYQNDFFIHVETKLEPLLHNTFRNYFIDRLTCPTPNYDQSVYRYDRKREQIEYLWTIPDRETCFHLLANTGYIAQAEQELLGFIIKFNEGALLRLCKKLNGEKLETPELIKNDK